MADYNGTVETYPDGRGFNSNGPADGPVVETYPDGRAFNSNGPADGPIAETFSDMAPHGLLLFSESESTGIDVRVEPDLPRRQP